MKQSLYFLVIQLVVFLMFEVVQSASVVPTFQLTNKYIQTGTCSLDTTSYYLNASLTSYQSTQFPITFLTTHPINYKGRVSIQDLSYDINGNYIINISLSAVYNKSTTYMGIMVFSTSQEKLSVLNVRYIVLDAGFTKISMYQIYCYIIGGGSQSINSSKTLSLSSYGLRTIIFSPGVVRNFLVMIGMSISSSSNCFDIKSTATRSSSTSMDVKVSTSCTSNIQIYYLSYTTFSYNENQVAAYPFPSAQLNYQDFVTPATYQDTSGYIQTYNTFWGLNHFNIKNLPSITWTSNYVLATSISGTSLLAFNNLAWSAVVFLFKECPTAIPFYYNTPSTCYNPCPPRTYTNITDMTCGACTNYACYTCTTSKTTCLTCSATIDFRTLSYGNCIPLDGYYDGGSNNSTAQPCDLTACLTCNSSSTRCFSCNPGFYLSSHTCKPCGSYCSVCTSNSICKTCDTGYQLTSSKSCQINCTAVLNCITCTSTIGCMQCDSGFNLINNISCATNCGDGVIIGTQQCDSGGSNGILGSGCSSTCTIISGYYCVNIYPTPSQCNVCLPNCLNCTTGTDCSLCQTNYIYIYDPLTPGCIFDFCTNVVNCVSCLQNSSYTSGIQCLICSLGYSALPSNGSSCDSVCGDGVVINSTQTCDTGNLNGQGGCSSTCTIVNGYYCTLNSTNGSTCTACMTNCLQCTTGFDCSSCNPLTIQITLPNTTCSPICSLISQCLICHISNNIIECDSCITGYQSNLTSCNPTCGDGILIDPQACDDGNIVNGDGCSSTCTIEPAFYCIDQGIMPASQCSSCLQFCLSCTLSSNCNACIKPSTYDNISSCVVPCGSNTTCATCTFSSNYSVVCATCIIGYAISSNKQCLVDCGDGILISPNQQCDDHNNLSGDGCSSMCQIQTYFGCDTSPPNYSVCYLKQLNLPQLYLTKDPLSNSATMIMKPQPGNLPIFSTINWGLALIPPSNDATITSYNYDKSTGLLSINFNYNSDINSNVVFGINPNASAALMHLGNQTCSVAALSSDNQALVAYPSQDYKLASIISNLAIVAAALSILMVLIGLVGGRLIGLQTAAVVQVAYLSLLTVDNMSPTFTALEKLGLSCGFNKLHSYDFTQSIQTPFKGIQMDVNFILNYNIMTLMIFVPLLIAIISKILAKTVLKNRLNLLSTIGQYSLYEYILYGYLFNAYIINCALMVTVLYFSKASSTSMQTVGLLLGIIFLGVGVVYFILFKKGDNYFGQFKRKFVLDAFSQQFYLLLIVQRLITSIFLASLISVPFQNAILISLFLSQMIIIIKKKPYKGKRKWLRPTMNMIICILIQLIYQIVNFLNNPKNVISIYGPLVILCLLLICIVYNIYYFVRDVRQAVEKIKMFIDEYNQQPSSAVEEIQKMYFQDLKAIILNGHDQSIVKNINETMGDMTSKEINTHWNNYAPQYFDELTPKCIQLTQIKNKLKEQKIETNSPQTKQANLVSSFMIQDLSIIS